MSRRIVGLAVLALALAVPDRATAQQGQAPDFRQLRAAQIRTRLVGRDMTDDYHWSQHFRRDGVLEVSDLGRRRVGRWRLDGDRLCLQRPPETAFDCAMVWIRGDEIALRHFAGELTHPAFIRPHQP